MQPNPQTRRLGMDQAALPRQVPEHSLPRNDWAGGPSHTQAEPNRSAMDEHGAGGNGESRDMKTPEEFWRWVDRGEACWTWGRRRGSNGYGIHMAWRGRRERPHRIAWEIAHGAPPGAMDVCHRCDNPACVRPDHLFLGTAKDNGQDAALKGRTARGVRNGQARLTADDVAEIRLFLAAGYMQHEIACAFGVARTTINAIRRGDNWKWLPE